MKNYEHISVNIRKLMKFFDLDFVELATVTGISIAGLRKMINTASYKLENLDKIAESLYVSTFVLICDEILIETYRKDNKDTVIIKWKINSETNPVPKVWNNKEVFPIYNSNIEQTQYQDIEINKLEDKISDQEFDIERKSSQITFLNEQVKFYKDQAEAFKFLSEQIMQDWKEKLQTPKGTESE